MKNFLFSLYAIFFSIGYLQAQEIQIINALSISAAVSQPLIESEVFHLINKHRIANSLKPLHWASTPAHLARKHSLNMANGKIPVSHEGIDLRYAEAKQKIPSLTRYGENVAYTTAAPLNLAEKVVNAWLASPGHYASIMGDFNLSGVGVALNSNGGYYLTQIFIKADLVSTSSEDSQEASPVQEVHVSDSPVQLEVEF